MDEKILTEFILTQLAALLNSAEAGLPTGHKVIKALEEAMASILDDDFDEIDEIETPEAIIPQGFDAETYDAFLEEQVEVVFPERAVDSVRGSITDVVGTVITEDGTVTEVGDVIASAAAVDQIIADLEEEQGEELETPNIIKIKYTRLDDKELTVDDVNSIINHPVSSALKHLGSIQLLEINNTDSMSEKDAIFGILEEGTISLKILALGAASYRGVSVFPGIGRVQAVGSTNFA